MKLKITMMLIILGMLSVMPMIYMGKLDPMALLDFGLDTDIDVGSISKQVPKSVSSIIKDEKVQVYKWRDENGVLQFSNTPPTSAQQTEQIELDPNSNVVQAVKVPEKEAPKATAKAEVAMPTPYSMKGMKKVMDDAKGVEQLLQQRHETQQEMLKDY